MLCRRLGPWSGHRRDYAHGVEAEFDIHSHGKFAVALPSRHVCASGSIPDVPELYVLLDKCTLIVLGGAQGGAQSIAQTNAHINIFVTLLISCFCFEHCRISGATFRDACVVHDRLEATMLRESNPYLQAGRRTAVAHVAPTSGALSGATHMCDCLRSMCPSTPEPHGTNGSR